MSKGDIFPVNNNAIDDNNFPRYRSTYCDFSICSPYNAALLPFVGDLSKSIFGIATENDVRVLAGHINALTRQQKKVVRALARHGGDLSSYINQVGDRMDNLMEGIKVKCPFPLEE
jgi:hypothetical protein